MNYFLIVLISAIVLAIVMIIATGYVKAPPDMAYIISGYKRQSKILIGRAGIRIPFLERLDKLLLKQITVDIKTEGYIPTIDFINIKVDAVAKVKVSSDPMLMKEAMKNFLNKSEQEITHDLQDSLQGNMREIIGTLTLRGVCNNREEFGNQVQEKASVDMKKLGIEIISCNIQNVEDESDLIKNMGMDNTAKIRKEAAIAKAEADRDVEIKKAEADKEANEARVKADLEIAQKNNELDIKRSELLKISETKRAEAEAAYEIQKQEQRKTIEQTSTNADIAKREREVELKQREVEVMEQALDAEVKKKAEAEKYRQEQEADAKLYIRTKEAEAKKVEMEREAEATKTRAEAEKYKQEQEALAIKAKGEAEAEAIKAKGLAEAEAIDRKAEAMKKYGQAAIIEMLVNVLPEVAKNVAEPISAIDKVTVIGGNSNGVSDVAGNVPIVMAKVFESVKEATGIDMTEIVKAQTFEGQTTKNINLTGIPEHNNKNNINQQNANKNHKES